MDDKGRALLPDSLIDDYLGFCRDHGGLKPTTTDIYLRKLLGLGSFLARRGVGNLRKLAPADLDAFLTYRSSFMSPSSLQSVATAMRSLLRYLYLHGRISRDLAATVVSPCRFSADLRPKYLPWRRIEELLGSVDRSTAKGKRDYAILVLLACHGLRASEAAAIKLDDINFDRYCLRLRHRKNGTTADIPLSERAALALRDTLAARRDSAHSELFLTSSAPIRPIEPAALSHIAAWHLRRCFGGRGGAYTLRHSFAKALLDRGARLHDIGMLLGHKSLRSTLIYTRIATEDMREVASNYAEWL